MMTEYLVGILCKKSKAGAALFLKKEKYAITDHFKRSIVVLQICSSLIIYVPDIFGDACLEQTALKVIKMIIIIFHVFFRAKIYAKITIPTVMTVISLQILTVRFLFMIYLYYT